MLIGEVAQHSGVSARMLRHYDALGLVRPTGRTAGGYREYSAGDVERILHVESLRSLGLSLSEVQRALDDPGFAPSVLVRDLIEQTRERLAREEELLARLRRVAATGPTDWDDVLRIVSLLRALGSRDAGGKQQAVLSAGRASSSLPAEELAEAVLAEDEPNVAGTIRWALARAGQHGLTALAAGLASPDREVRTRAVTAVADIAGRTGRSDRPDGSSRDESAARATALLRSVLTDPDAQVRGHAALALGSQDELDAVPVLVEMVTEGRNDVEAAEALGRLARSTGTPEILTRALVDGVGDDAEPPVRRRLAQALAEIPGSAARPLLESLAQDEDRSVLLTARAVLRRRDDQGGP